MRQALVAVVLAGSCLGLASAVPLVVYDDALQNGFQDWGWAPHSYASTTHLHSGTYSASVTFGGWDALYLHDDASLDGATYDALDFFVNGGAGGGQSIDVVFLLSGTELARVSLAGYVGGAIPPNGWVSAHIPIDPLGLGAATWNELYFANPTGGSQPTFWLDDIQFLERAGGGGGSVAIAVDPDADRRPIDPRVYGVNGNPSFTYPVMRWGGNATTRYNWMNDTSNRASDWFFLNIPGAGDPNTLPDGSEADLFIDDVLGRGAQPILTIPLIGYAPRDRVKRPGFSQAKYGAQTDDECRASGNPPWCMADAGNGLASPGGNPIVGNDPADTSIAIGPSFVTSWMSHIAARVGSAGAGGVRYFALDNEPMLWSSTHRDVHPARLDYQEIWQRTLDYAGAIKAQDPDAVVLGPVLWGWCAYFYSDADDCGPGPDYAAHGPFLAWYLDQIQQHQNQTGVRLVDMLDLHYYPQASGVALSGDESAATSARRLRSVKDLYDPTYVAESWIGQPVDLIPRMKGLIAAHAPGMSFALTEYNWGNDAGLSSALAQVEILGVLGREGVDLATRWVAPAAGSRVDDAFRLYLDYDGAGSSASGESVRAASASVNSVGSYAIRDASNRLFLYLVNKDTTARDVDVTVATPYVGDVALFGFDAGTTLGPRGTVIAPGAGFTITLPPRSATLAVGQFDCPLPSPVVGLDVTKSGAGLHLGWTDQASATDYVVAEDVAPGGTFGTETGTATSGATGLDVTMPAGDRYYRVAARNGCGTGPP